MTDASKLRVVGAGALAEGRMILAQQFAATWEFADWAARQEVAALPIRETAEALGISRQELNEYGLVSTIWPVSDRAGSLTFSHHQRVARAPEEARVAILAQAAEHNWSVAQTQAAAGARPPPSESAEPAVGAATPAKPPGFDRGGQAGRGQGGCARTRGGRAVLLMVALIGAVAAPSQGVSYYERDGYYANGDPDYRTASA